MSELFVLVLETKSSNSLRLNLLDAVSSDALPAAINSSNSFSNNALCRARRFIIR